MSQYIATWYQDLIKANGGNEPNDGGIVAGPHQPPVTKSLKAYVVSLRPMLALARSFDPAEKHHSLTVLSAEFGDSFIFNVPGYLAYLVVSDDVGLARLKEALIKVAPDYAEDCPF